MTDALSTPATDRRPAFARAFAAVAEIDGLSVYERAAITSAIAWVSFDTGELWPSKTTWARQAGMSERQLYKVLADLERKGIATRKDAGNKGGRGNVTTWRFAVLAVDGQRDAGSANTAQPVQGLAQLTGPKPCTPNTVSDAEKPCTRRGNPAHQVGNPAHGVTNPAQLVQTNSHEQPTTATEPFRAPVQSTAAKYIRDRRARTTDDPPGFLRFEAAYPPGKLGNRAVARGIWEDLGLEHAADGIVAAVETLRTSRQWTEQEGRFIPSGATFLGGEKWRGVKVKAKSPFGEVASDAEQAAFRAWWAKVGEQPREVFSRHYGATAATVTQWVSWGHVRTAMVERMRKEQHVGVDARG